VVLVVTGVPLVADEKDAEPVVVSVTLSVVPNAEVRATFNN